MSVDDTSTILSKYPLGDDPIERERLVGQYIGTKKVFSWTSPIPKSFDVTAAQNVIDIAAGTCVWVLDFASQPQVKARIASKELNVYACDLALTKFPPKQFTDEMGIQTFQQDVTKPFPEAMYGTFDLVHLSLVVLALTKEGWEKALENCRNLLKPGGTLWTIENDPVFHSGEQPLSMVAELGHDYEANMDGSTWRHKYNCVYTGTAMLNGTYTDLSFHMPSLLEKFGLRTIFTQKCVAPFGKLCERYPALADEVERTAQNSDIMHIAMANNLFKQGVLEAPKGTKITSESDKERLASEMKEGVRKDGAYIVLFEFIATKDSD